MAETPNIQYEMPKAYEPGKVEAKWYKFWLEKGYFRAEIDPDKKPFVVIMPLPNVTGGLHIGHVMFITPEDLSVSFEITTTPDDVANLILILSDRIPAKLIHVTDSFIITKDTKGERIAVFGSDAQTVYEHNLATQFRNQNDYLNVLKSPNVKFYNC